MRIADYIMGQRYVLRSPLPVEQVKERINSASGSRFWPFKEGIVGGFYLGRLVLAYQGFFLTDYNAKPRLIGRFENEMGATIMRLKYRGPTWTVIFFGIWYLFQILLTSALAIGFFSDGGGENAEVFPFFLALVAAFLVAPILMHFFGTRNSDEELVELIDFLEREVQAKVLPSDSR